MEKNPSKDHSLEEIEEIDGFELNNELKTLVGKYKGNVKMTTEGPNTEIEINIRPNSGDLSFGSHKFSVALILSILPGYPRKCPKIRLAQEEVLSKENSEKLVSSLYDQASTCAKEGQKMICKLVLAAEEFLSRMKDAEKSEIKSGEEAPSENSQRSTSSQHAPMTDKRDLVLVNFLRMASTFKGFPSTALPVLSSELCSIGVLSDGARDLVTAPSATFQRAWDCTFGELPLSPHLAQLLKFDDSSDSVNPSPRSSSRYVNDFEEIDSLGYGGFGSVTLCVNKLDKHQYAVKKILLKDKDHQSIEKILREVTTLSQVQHQHVVRYYQSWIETSYVSQQEKENDSGSMAEYTDVSSADTATDELQEVKYLYIQMEYCPRTLLKDFQSYESKFSENYARRVFCQILKGMADIHRHGIIHRDLKPGNILFDENNDVKIADFGLAKFLKVGQSGLDQKLQTTTRGASGDDTRQIGTFFYRAPELEKDGPQIDDKVDIYSLGVIFFELWHPFSTGVERIHVLTELKSEGSPPRNWVEKYPVQALLLRCLMAPNPSDRPSAIQTIP